MLYCNYSRGFHSLPPLFPFNPDIFCRPSAIFTPEIMHIITNNLFNSYGPLLLTGKKSFQESCDYIYTTLNFCSSLTVLWCWNVAKVTESGMNGYCSVSSCAEHHVVWHLMFLLQTHKSKGKIKRMFIYYVYGTCFTMLAIAVILVSDIWCTCPRKT